METAVEPQAVAPVIPVTSQNETAVPAPAAPAAAPKAAKASAANTPEVKWTDSLNEDLKGYVQNKGFQDTGAVIESYRNLEKLHGVSPQRILKLPETAEDTAWNDVYTKLGKPSTPDGYGLKSVEGSDPTFTDWAKSAFHKLHLTSDQGQNLVKQFSEFTAAQESAALAKKTDDVRKQTDSLKKEWGNAYNQNLARAQHAYRTFGLEDKAITALESAIGVDGVMKFMHDLGAKIGEHGFVSGENSQNFNSNVLTPAQAKAQIEAKMQDASFKKRYLEKEVKAVEEFTRLHIMAAASD